MKSAVTARSVIISVLLIPVHIWWIHTVEAVLYSVSPTALSVFFTSVFILLCLMLLNAGVKKVRPEKALSQRELLVIYIAMNVSGAVIGHDFMHVFLSDMCHPLRYATAENNWYNLFINKMPDWSVVKDKAAADAFYTGGASFFQWKILKHWLGPLSMWGAFMMILFCTMLCVNTILRRQWTENEKLSFPLVGIPLEITDEKTKLFSNRFLYAGIFIGAAFTVIQGLNGLFPSFPVLDFKTVDLGRYLTDPPLNAMGSTPVRLYPLAIGIIFMAPADLSFSYWFFYLFMKAQFVLGAAAGINNIQRFPFIPEQCFGFILGIFVFALYSGRAEFRRIFLSVFGKKGNSDSGEPMDYRHAVWGMLLGLLCLMLFSRALGTSCIVAAAAVGGYFIISIAITRTRAELGAPCHEINQSAITYIMLQNLGTATLGAQNVIGLQHFYFFNRCYRTNMMPVQMESLKLSQETGLDKRKTAGILMLFSFLSVASGFVIALSRYYSLGAAANMNDITILLGSETYGKLESFLKNGTIPDWNGIAAVATGFIGCALLGIARLRIPGFPLNPVAYAMMSSYQTNNLWVSAFAAWLFKVIILKYGGLKGFSAALPFFLGLIIGDALAGTFWSIISIILGFPVYSVFP
ncbi:MAG: hypothetical protein ILO36_02060 [Abditibacteriota bacterium]|nr:hypothetical protein [Abditibacteriota bacterium]